MNLLDINYILLSNSKNGFKIKFYKNDLQENLVETLIIKTRDDFIIKMIAFYEFIKVNKFKNHILGDNSILFIKQIKFK